MSRFAPRTQLETHEVANQPRPLVDVNLFDSDLALRDAAVREGGGWVVAPLSALGAEAGSEAVLELGDQANRYPPELTVFDRYGRRIDEARFHPSYHQLMDVAMRHGIHDIAWRTDGPGGHVAHAAMLALLTEAESGVLCPISMTYASVPALRHQPDVTQPWLDRLIGGTYDAPLKPVAEKRGVTLGMAMTEKQGGSDVRANSTRATPIGDGLYRLVGHKWFCSAPMSDGFLTLAYAEGGLTCFLVPRIAPDGSRNGIQVMRLKDKLGNKSNASSEIEYHDAVAWKLGEEGRGVSVIIDMVHHTRLDTMAGTLGIMRRPLAEAVNHVMGRRAFQRTLIDQPAMRGVIADLALEYEAAALLTMRVASAFDGQSEGERAFARLAVALGKYWLTKRCPNFVYECMESHGGVGYVEETPLPRYFRESPLNAIWEGSGNVIALDVLRTLHREPAALEAFAAEVATARGADVRLDAAAQRLTDRLAGSVGEGDARRLVEDMALLLQGTLMAKHASAPVADAFLASRIGGDWGRSFGALPAGVDVDAIVARQTEPLA
ncbi:acyl-CoA dehydrogenase family protein [Caulobacter mirabilis]|uniref:DNA alkylation response protein n=1 Tax=Caulobacter mirabilis TaxID=69666 RepID=A0A2D2AWV2_9CAUL|nr:acyl-CoA dehydrogenase family protein [Caulobacter mirabilis]ATQ42489.1 DNA alkylation response protein [Caulobacter mirabilis]